MTDLDLRKRVTQERLSDFRAALQRLEARRTEGNQDGFLPIEIAATRSEIDRLVGELEALKQEDNGTDLNNTLGHPPCGSTLQAAVAIATDLGILSSDFAPSWDTASVLPSLNARGLSSAFLRDRIMFDEERFGIQDGKLIEDLEVATLQRALSIDASQPLDSVFDQLGNALPNTRVQLKTRVSANPDAVRLYSRYVDYLVNVIVESVSSVRYIDLFGIKPEEMRREILDQYAEVTLQSVLSFAWSRGIPVLPLNDPGRFEGAHWRHKDRPVVVMNLRDRSESRWLLLLIHELAHIAQGSDDGNIALLENANFVSDWNNSEAEQEARWFALDVALGERPEKLTQQVVEAAGGDVKRLKNATVRISRLRDIDQGILADFLAFQLMKSDVDWWGTASNLQPTSSDPLLIARNAFHRHLDLDQLKPFDAHLMRKAVPSEHQE